MYKVYKYTSPSNKIYIGITSKTLNERAKYNGCGYDRCSYFAKAINKYGWENFTSEILAQDLTEEEAKRLEKYYIKLYDSTNPEKGYNITMGGDGTTFYNADEIVELWQSGLGITEITKQLGCCNTIVQNALNAKGIDGKERIKRSAGKYHQKRVYQFDKQGNFLNEYESVAEAERQTNVHHGNIVRVCKGERKSAGGFKWSYDRPPCEKNN